MVTVISKTITIVNII